MFKKDFFIKFTILHSFLGNFYLDQVFSEKMLIGNLYLASALFDYPLFHYFPGSGCQETFIHVSNQHFKPFHRNCK